MNIKHPYFHGHLSTRLVALEQSQETLSDIIKHLPVEFMEEHMVEVQVYMAQTIDLWATANHHIIRSLAVLVSDEYKEMKMNEELKKSSDDVLKKWGEPGA